MSNSISVFSQIRDDCVIAISGFNLATTPEYLILELYKRLIQDFKICSLELLNMWDGKKAYSLAQGQ